MTDRERPQHGRGGTAVEVLPANPDPDKGHGLGGPGDRDDRRAELDGHRHRQGGQPGPGHQEPEQVAIPFRPQEPAADREVSQRHAGQERVRARPRDDPSSRANPAATRNAALAMTSVAVAGRRVRVRRRTSSPAAATSLIAQ